MNRYYTLLGGLCLCISMLAGCIRFDIPQNYVTKTNQVLSDQPVGKPAAAAGLPPAFSIGNEDIPTPDGQLHMVLTASDPQRPLIVFCGGNEFRERQGGAGTLRALAPFGDVVLFDYPGLGGSSGHGTKDEYLTTVDRVATHVSALAGNRRGPLIFWGHSLGTGFCAALAEKVHHPSITVLAGAFDTVEDAANGMKNHFFWYGALLVPHVGPNVLNFHIADRLARYDGPIILLSSRKDQIITYDVSHRLEEKLIAEGRKVIFVTLETAGHNDLHRDPAFVEKMTTALKPYGISYTPIIWP